MRALVHIEKYYTCCGSGGCSNNNFWIFFSIFAHPRSKHEYACFCLCIRCLVYFPFFSRRNIFHFNGVKEHFSTAKIPSSSFNSFFSSSPRQRFVCMLHSFVPFAPILWLRIQRNFTSKWNHKRRIPNIASATEHTTQSTHTHTEQQQQRQKRYTRTTMT